MLKNVKEKISISKIGQNKYYKIKVYVFQGFVEMSEVETNCFFHCYFFTLMGLKGLVHLKIKIS